MFLKSSQIILRVCRKMWAEKKRERFFNDPPFSAVFYEDDEYRLALTPSGAFYSLCEKQDGCWVQVVCADTAEKMRYRVQRGLSPLHPIVGIVAQLPLLPVAFGWRKEHAFGRAAYSDAAFVVPTVVENVRAV